MNSVLRGLWRWPLALGFGVAAMLVLAPVMARADDGQGVLHTAKGDFTFHLEVVDTEAGREKGLMFRESLAPDAGMLFDFQTEQNVAFWMKNTLIPLDMVFIAANGAVKTIKAEAQPHDLTPVPSGAPVRFVLEIAGGRAAEIGLEPGDRFEADRVQKTP